MYNNILLEVTGKIATITINRPDKLNALNKETISELNQALNSTNKNTEIRAIILTGSGTKSFVAGADISEFAKFTQEQGETLAANGQNILFNFIEHMQKPVIAAVNGFALGGGLELALACHIRLASSNAKLGLPEVSLGVIPGYGGTQRLTQLVGKGKALELILSANMLTAQEAYQYGLVNHVYEQENLLFECEKLASKIASNSPFAISKAIEAVNAGFTGQTKGLNAEIKAFGECFGTPEFVEGTTAFLEKRKPNF